MVGNNDVNKASNLLIPKCFSLLSSNDKINIVQSLPIPKMGMKAFTGLLSDIELSIPKMYLLGNYLKMHLNSWIFPDVR